MDDPGFSLFQGDNLNLNNENQEEAEDLEEQIRRREELQDLLINALDDFKYDDSTINSSTNISIASADGIDHAYKEAQTPIDQLKLLYEIRMKEIRALKEEFDEYKLKTSKEIDGLKRKLTLQEAETSQIEISLRNTKSLLVEKVDIIAKQEERINEKDNKIIELEKCIEELHYDVQAYSRTIEELQLKMTMDTGPLNMAARVFNVEELQKNHREQVQKLENLLEEQKKKCEILEKDAVKLDEELKNTVETYSQNEMLQNNTITLLNANIESAQNQCKDLLSLVEMLSQENDHYRGRVEKNEAGDPILLSGSFKKKSMDYDSLLTLSERLKKLLLDKDVELSTLKAKTKFYERDAKELLEYRSIKNKSLLNKECNQLEHAEKFALLQNELKNLQIELNEKNREIKNSHSINRELEDKIEQMIMQTRTDLENLSQKYKLPELETMNEELKNAESKIRELESELNLYKNENDDLKSELNEHDINEVKTLLEQKEKRIAELEEINEQLGNIKDLKNIKADFEFLKKEYDQISAHLLELNQGENHENSTKYLANLRTDIEEFWSIFKNTKLQRDAIEIKIASWINQINVTSIVMRNLIESEKKFKDKAESHTNNLNEIEKEVVKLTEIIEEVNKSNMKLKNENLAIQRELEKVKNEVISKTNQVEMLRNEDATVQTLENASHHLEEAKEELLKYQEQLNRKDEEMKKLGVELDVTREKLKSSRVEMDELKRKISELETKAEEGTYDEKLHEVKLISAEVTIREKLREEYEMKIKKIEDNYRKIFESNQEKLKKFKENENNYRVQLVDILNKYARVIAPIQKENKELRDYVAKIEEKHREMKAYVENSKKECSESIEKTQKDAQKSIDQWKIWAKTFVQGCLSIEKLNAQSRNKIIGSLQEFDSQINSIDRAFEEKMKNYKKKHNLSRK